ncbi:hypothetical protein COU60_01315 [Candidatus Pacearchaeota archaeon CG10_big_fil_rev_8_21_14_0_10_34_76]|nr:MAG: hypothetical protein COU60_01315 [Candidatus Pacearchaeota archaeon CG10_big_fil_rev_8_21_14_0_10_34_76]
MENCIIARVGVERELYVFFRRGFGSKDHVYGHDIEDLAFNVRVDDRFKFGEAVRLTSIEQGRLWERTFFLPVEPHELKEFRGAYESHTPRAY